MTKYFIIIGALFLGSCENKNSNTNPKVENENISLKYSYEILKYDNGWGYTISSENKPMIIQKHIPSVQGVAGFQNEHQAKKCAELVIIKLETGVFPPSVSKEELDGLGIDY